MAEPHSRLLQPQYVWPAFYKHARTKSALTCAHDCTHAEVCAHANARARPVSPSCLDTQPACGWSQCWVKLITQLNYRLWASVRGLDLTFSKCQPVTALLAGLSVCLCVCVCVCVSVCVWERECVYGHWQSERAAVSDGIGYIENVSLSLGYFRLYVPLRNLLICVCVCVCVCVCGQEAETMRDSVNVCVCLKFV